MSTRFDGNDLLDRIWYWVPKDSGNQDDEPVDDGTFTLDQLADEIVAGETVSTIN